MLIRTPHSCNHSQSNVVGLLPAGRRNSVSGSLNSGMSVRQGWLPAAIMKSRNQLFSGFQNFGGGVNLSPTSGLGMYNTGLHYNGQILNRMFAQTGASLQQMQLQTAMQMNSILNGG